MTQDEKPLFDRMLREAAQLKAPADELARLPRIGEIVQEKYRVEQELDHGGMGAVFRATNVETGKAVALKWPLSRSPRARCRFLREVRASARIDHPNVVNVFDLGSHEGSHFLVMELLKGESLGSRLRRGPLAPCELMEIMIPVLHGLSAAHAAGVIHRDIKPENVFLCEAPDGTLRAPKLIDFGISRLKTESHPYQRLTEEGAGIGTIAYMSPEQLAGTHPVDERTDIYSAGVMMFEALTQRLPPLVKSPRPPVVAGSEPLAAAPALAPGLERVLSKAMALEAADRQADVASLIADLVRCAPLWIRGPQAETRHADPVPSGAASQRRSLRFGWVGAAALLITAWLVGRPATSPVQATQRSDAANLTVAARAVAEVPDNAIRAQSVVPHSADPLTAPPEASTVHAPEAPAHRAQARRLTLPRLPQVTAPAGRIHPAQL